MTTVAKWTLDQSGIALLKNKLESYWVDWVDLGQQASGWSLAARMNEPGVWLKYKHIGDGLYQTFLMLPDGQELIVTNLLPLLGPAVIELEDGDVDNPLTQIPADYTPKELGAETRLTQPAPQTADPSFVARIKAFFGFGDKP